MDNTTTAPAPAPRLVDVEEALAGLELPEDLDDLLGDNAPPPSALARSERQELTTLWGLEPELNTAQRARMR